jgi:hypothetical protein
MLVTSKLSTFRERRALATIILLPLSAFIFATPYVWPNLVAGPPANEATSTTTIALRNQIQLHGDSPPLAGGWFVADLPDRESSIEEQVLSIDIKYPRSMRLNETPTVDFTMSAKEGSYNRTLFIKLSSAGFKIDPETPLEMNSNALPTHQTWTISPNSEGNILLC